MDLKQAKELVRSRLSDKRYEHTINVKKMAVKLAKHYGTDPEQAALAALLHDAAKALPTESEKAVAFHDNVLPVMDALRAAKHAPRRCGTASVPPFWRVPSGALRTKPCSAPLPAIPQARRA